jgi:protein-tyrosine phosphatase
LVDIHSHIVYGVDDGARTLEDSLAMLNMAADCGTTDIVATPHSDLKYAFNPTLVRDRIAELQEHMGDRIRIHRGCDFHLHFDNISHCLQDRTPYTINGKRYLMVEFAEDSLPKTITSVLRDMDHCGITPVVTHPERNAMLMKRISQMVEWVRFGCLLQVTAQSFTGRFGKSAQTNCATLMDMNMVHFVASDAHDTEWRPPDLREAYKHVTAEYGADVAHRLFVDYPRMAVAGDYIDCADPYETPPKRSWFKLW